MQRFYLDNLACSHLVDISSFAATPSRSTDYSFGSALLSLSGSLISGGASGSF